MAKRVRAVNAARTVLAPLVAIVAVLALAGCGADTEPAQIQITMHYAHYEPARVTVAHGRAVTFVLRNDDPIDHEWIVGTEAVHEAHRNGTEPYHASRPTEVTIPALSTRTTTITFDQPGTLRYICHLPGHELYGMVGTLEIT